MSLVQLFSGSQTASEFGLRLLRVKHGMIRLAVCFCNLRNVIFCLFKIGNLVAAFFNSAFARVIARESKVHIAVEAFEQPAQITNAAVNILFRVSDVCDVESFGCGGGEVDPALSGFSLAWR